MSRILVACLLIGTASASQDLPDSYLGRFQLAYEALEDGRAETAVALYESCFELAPENPTTAYHLACAHAKAERFEDALDWLDRAVEWGYPDDAVMAWDPDLVGLSGRPRFEELISRLSTTPVAAAEDSGAEVRWLAPRSGKMSLSRSGTRAVTDGWGETWMWDTTTWDLVAVLLEDDRWKDCAPAPGGESFIVAWNDSRLRLGAWDAVTGRALWEVEMPPDSRINRLCPWVRFSRDGEQIILQDSSNSSLSKWHVRVSDGHLVDRRAEAKELELAPLSEPAVTMERHPRESSWASAVTPIGDSVIAFVTEGSKIRLVDVATTSLLSSREGGLGRIRTMEFVDEHALLVLGGEERTGFFDMRSGDNWNVPGHMRWPSPEEHRVAVADGTFVRIIDLRTKRPLLEVTVGSQIQCATWSHDGARLAVGRATEVRIFDAESGAEALPGPLVHPVSVFDVSFHTDDRRLATAGSDAWLRIWDTETGKLLSAPACPGIFGWSHVEDVHYTADGSLLLAVLGDIPDVEARDAESLDLIWSHTGFSGGPNWLRLQLTKSGRLLCGGENNSESRILNLADGSLIMDFDYDVKELVASPGEEYVFTVRDGAIDVLHGRTLERLYTRVEFPDEGELVFLPSLYCRGTPEALRNTWLIRDGRATSMESVASVLYDPKRVAAGAAGVPVRPPTFKSK